MNRPYAFVLASLLALCAQAAQAQAWPQRPVRMVVAFPPGGSTDIAVRVVAERIAPALGQPVLVENRTGASGNVAAEFVVKQPADGYLVLATADALASTPHLYKLAFDPAKDFVPVVQLTRQPVVLAAHPSTGVNTLAELVALAKAKPGLAYATSGAGSLQHMAGEWFAKLAGIHLTHVPYKGGGQAIGDVVGGTVPLASLGLPPTAGHIKAGRLKAFAVTSKVRQKLLPDTPTFQEGGVPGFETVQWWGPAVPAGTPAPVVKKIYDEFVKAMKNPKLIERYNSAGLEVTPSASPEAYTAFIKAEIERWAPVVKASGARVDN
jgi:tripartite-type tricarboxylate transporter receptor subunit TctC